MYLYEESHEDLKVLDYQRSNLIDAFICLPNLLMKFLCSSVSSCSVSLQSLSVSLSNSSNSVKKVQASLTKVTAVKSDDMNRSTNSLNSEVVELFTQLYLEKTPIRVLDFAFSYTASGRPPALSFVVSLRTVLCLTGL